MALLKVYLLNGQHIDIELNEKGPKSKIVAETIGETGVWAEERGERIYYPPHQIFRIRLCKEKFVAPKVEVPKPDPEKELNNDNVE